MKTVVMVAVVVLGAILATSLPSLIVAQSSCKHEIASLSPCYSYIYESGSTQSPACCSRLKNVVKTKAECLCELVKGEGFNKTRLLQLPTACNVHTPPVTLCYTSSPPPSGYSTKISNSVLLYVLIIAASYAGVLIIF